RSGGVFAALSETTPDVVRTAMESARKHGTRVSYDLNYRESLWRSFGGKERARAVNRSLLSFVDVVIGNEEDFSAALGFELEGVDEHYTALPVESFRRMILSVMDAFPNVSTVAVTLRTARTASRNGWGALACHRGQFLEVPEREIEVFDRVGGGDSFASGFLYGLLSGRDPEFSLACGVAHGAPAMSTPAHTSPANLPEVVPAPQRAISRTGRSS